MKHNLIPKSGKKLPLIYQGISVINSLLRNGEITTHQLFEECDKTIDRTKRLNAFVLRTKEIAKDQVVCSNDRFKEKKSLGPIDGIPIAIKDNFCTRGVRTSCASKMLLNYIPPYNATVVQKLLERNGAVLMGKTNLDEFAMGAGCVDSVFGPTINPWRSGLKFKIKSRRTDDFVEMLEPPSEEDWFISGGSSGGSAVAVATGCVLAAIASDTGGSTRNPAARVGVIGLKPTYGLVSRYGLIPLTHSMDVPGILTRSAEDAALVLKLIMGHDTCDSTTSRSNADYGKFKEIDLKDVTIGIPEEYKCDGISPEIIELWSSISDQLANLGAKVKSVSLPHTKYSISCYSVLNCCEVASNFSCYDGIEFGHRSEEQENSVEELYSKSRHEGFSETVRGRILTGNFFLLRENYETYFNQALKVRRLIADDFERVFHDEAVDFLLTPVTLTEAPLYSKWKLKDNREQVSTEDYCTQPVNMAGLPAVSVPCKLSRNGLPISLQLIGRRFKDFFMLSVAKKLEEIVDFPILILDNVEE